MGPTCWLKSLCFSSCCHPVISILMQACRQSHPHVFFPFYPPYPSFIYTPFSLGRHTHFLTQAYRNLASSTALILLSSFSIPLHHLHGVLRVHVIPHSFAYPLNPLTKASISIRPTKPVSLSKLSPTCGILPKKMPRGSLSLARGRPPLRCVT